jgi:tRNA threonylcarbamoyladenosine modification (KEOPS) complex  Pcc1 subunit
VECEPVKASAVARFGFSSERHLDVVLRALEPEVGKPATSRSRESLKRDGLFLVLRVEAADTVALRAALNAYLRWASSIMEVLDVVEKHGE